MQATKSSVSCPGCSSDEFWAGVATHHIECTCVRRVHVQIAQIAYSRRLDILSTCGFLATLEVASWLCDFEAIYDVSALYKMHDPAQVRHIITNGCCWFGIPCSSWIFMCLGVLVLCVCAVCDM